MSNMLEDGVQGMIGTLLAKAGVPCVYSRTDSNGVTNNDTFTMRKSRQRPVVIDNGNGSMATVLVTDFTLDPTVDGFAQFYPPHQGDVIQVDGETYSVQPTTPNDKTYFQAANHQMRIHTKRIA